MYEILAPPLAALPASLATVLSLYPYSYPFMSAFLGPSAQSVKINLTPNWLSLERGKAGKLLGTRAKFMSCGKNYRDPFLKAVRVFCVP